MVWIVRMRESVLPTARVMEEMTFDTYREAHAWLGTKMAESEPIPGMVYGHWREGQPAFKADVIKVPHLGLVPISTSVVLDQIEGLAANRVSGYDNQQARLLEIRDQIRRLRATTLPEYEYEARVTSGYYVGEQGPVVAGAPSGDASVYIELSRSGRKRVSHGQYEYRRYGSHTWIKTEPEYEYEARVTSGDYEGERGPVVAGAPPGDVVIELSLSGRKPVSRGQYEYRRYGSHGTWIKTEPDYEYEARVTSGDYVGERGPVVAGAPPGDVDIELSLSGRKRVSHGQYQYRRYGSHGTWTMSRTAAPRHHHQGGGLGFGFGGLGFAGAATEPAPSAPLRSFAGFAGAPQIYIRVTHGEYECEEGLVVSGSPPGNLKVDLEESGRKPVNRGQYVIL